MIEAFLLMLGLGGACASALSIASKVFYVWEDPRIAEVEGFMAGANCGGCGFAGFSAGRHHMLQLAFDLRVCRVLVRHVA